VNSELSMASLTLIVGNCAPPGHMDFLKIVQQLSMRNT
jgi:hypothetical protein